LGDEIGRIDLPNGVMFPTDNESSSTLLTRLSQKELFELFTLKIVDPRVYTPNESMLILGPAGVGKVSN